MRKTDFAMFLWQLGLTPERYIYGSAGNGTNVEHEIRIRITNADKTGMVEPPQDSLSDYLEALHTMLYENRHTFELRAPPQRTTLPSVDREGNFPSGDALSEYIAKSYALADGISQYSEFVCRTSYDRTGKPQRDNTISGIAMAVLVNKMKQMRLRHQQLEKRLTSAYPGLWFQNSYPETETH